MDGGAEVKVQGYGRNRGVDIVQAVDEVDESRDPKANPHERIPQKGGPRIGELERKLDDGERQALTIRPHRAKDDGEADKDEHENEDEANPPKDRGEPGLQHARLIERRGAVPIAVEDVLV